MFKRDDRVCRETDGAGGRRGAPPPGRGRGRGRGPRAGPWAGPVGGAGRGLPSRSAPAGRAALGPVPSIGLAVLPPADTKPCAEGGISERRSPGEGAGSVSDPRLQGGGGEGGAEPPAVTCGSLERCSLWIPGVNIPLTPLGAVQT